MAEEEKNEFTDLEEEKVPEQEFSAVPDSHESMISSGAAGEVYDWSKAPEGAKAPPRIDLSGKEVTIKKAEIILPPSNRPWDKSRDGTKEYKYCTFVLHYDVDGQQEFYNGVRVFNREGKYSHPTIMRDRQNQASRLFGLYADFKEKDINECSLREFMAFLNSQPKALLKIEEVENPKTKEIIKKNFVEKFI